MAKYRKKPVVVEAEQFLVGKPLPFNDRGPYVCFDEEFYVVTIHGQRTTIALGDWIIIESNGEPGEFQAYPCKPEVFEASYESVDGTCIKTFDCNAGIHSDACPAAEEERVKMTLFQQ